jgi:alcohol dehydrogenase class IV
MWYFLSPKIVFGEDAIQELAQIEGQKAFIVTDHTIHSLGFVDLVVAQLDAAGLQWEIFDDVEPDPSILTVTRCAGKISEFKPDWILGLGGGSCLDAAKAAWFLYERPDVNLDAINPFEHFGLRQKARFITISTTSGTGADVSWGFALNDTENQSKLVRVSRELIPDMALVDPIFVQQLPPGVTTDAGMDVLVHAVEAYTNTWANDFTDALALKAIELVFTYLPVAYRSGNNLEAREHLHNAASMAGLAFSNTAIIIAHSLAHAVGARFHTHHGRTVGLFLPYTIEYNAALNPQRYADIAYYLHLIDAPQPSGAQELVKAVRSLASELDQPASLASLNISPNEFQQALPELVNNVLASLELIANPRQPDPKEIQRLFEYAYDGRSIDF